MAEYTLRIRRFDPQSGHAAFWEEHSVDMEPKQSVLDAILQIKDERMVDEVVQKIETFKKQEADLLYRIWPIKALEPGEYALIQYTEGKMNIQVWDFAIKAK